ncbi:MAG: hypothetical protein HY064_04620 [Bacteroidetes bacterium]|nr:hypothetical protein [Bacteroidota bacterium]
MKGIEKSSDGSPSENFFKAADAWKGTTKEGAHKNIPLPKSAGKIKVKESNLDKTEGDINSATVSSKLAMGTDCRIVDAQDFNGETYVLVRSLYTETKNPFSGWVKDGDVDTDIMLPNFKSSKQPQ